MKKLVIVLVVVLLLGFARDVMANGGGEIIPPPPAGQKDPNTALMLSAILPGLGQYYNDQVYYKGLFMGLLEAFGWVIVGATDDDWFGFIIISANHAISAIDAYVQADRINQGISLRLSPEGPVVAFSHKF